MEDNSKNPMQEQMETARLELLDTTLRNPLLNYKLLKARGVEISETDFDGIFDKLVHHTKSLMLVANNRTVQSDEEDNDAHTVLELDEPQPIQQDSVQMHKGNSLQTAHPEEELSRRLLRTYQLAQSFLEEQGVNTLFITFGRLVWYEDDNDAVPHHAPLVLIPVKLQRDLAKQSYDIHYTEEDLEANHSLAARLMQDFRLELPPLPEEDKWLLSSYLDSVKRVVRSQTRWSVLSEPIALGFFDFNKFLMFKDLDAGSWSVDTNPLDHPILKALLQSGFSENESPYKDLQQLDEILPPSESTNVLDADSSQVLAIADVAAGRNLVIQGPPGTGKSQTIANIIADAIANAKTVLFVSEKMAALNVVKKRLDSLGLGVACLELHSNKAVKKAVIHDLRSTLMLDRPVLPDMANQINQLSISTQDLNAYCKAINTCVGSSNVTLHRVYGELLKQKQSPELVNLQQISDLDIDGWTDSDYFTKLKLVEELQASLQNLDVPCKHLFWGVQRTDLTPFDNDSVKTAISNALHGTTGLITSITTLANTLGLPIPTTLDEARSMVRAARRAMDAPAVNGIALNPSDWFSLREDIEKVLGAGRRHAQLQQQYSSLLKPEAWSKEVAEIRQSVIQYGALWWRALSKRYRTAKRMLASMCCEQIPKEQDNQLKLLDAIIQDQQERVVIIQLDDIGRMLFGVQWQGEQSDWEVLMKLKDWVFQLFLEFGDGDLPQGILHFLVGQPDTRQTRTEIGAVEAAVAPFEWAIKTLTDNLQFDSRLRFSRNATLAEQPLMETQALLLSWLENLEKLNGLVSYLNVADTCCKNGLAAVVSIAESSQHGDRKLVDSFRKTYWSLLGRSAFLQFPFLGKFSAEGHQKSVETFRALDKAMRDYNRLRLATRHWEGIPSVNAGGQVQVLRQELERTRHRSIRRLISDTGKAIQRIKPVFMMSPLSVATYLAPSSIDFDIVVFDEASQVRPVDALGALVRGKQAVVVGDSKQLPPTSFFNKTTSEEIDDGEDDNYVGDIESILGLFTAQGAPHRRLRWHYRSRHESLIAVSNQEFYENDLVIFPSPDAARERSGLIYYHMPNSIYDRGNSKTNRQEAEAVAEAVMSHARRELRRPPASRLSLGVATFSMPQSQAVSDHLDLLRRRDPSCEEYFSIANHEPFFVKNLENVQGDERDVILISVGYGRDINGQVSMNFGPLNNEGGERRLNVLITRARQRCEVFTNLTSDDIDLRRAAGKGVAAFRKFLAYANSGKLDSSMQSDRDTGSPFEEDVKAALIGRGHSVVTQVGCAGFFIDMAVVDPEKPGRYLLGIECDGTTYHSAQSARDRDRLREQVLEMQGWKLHRIWSTSWFKDRETELERVHLAIQNARNSSAGNANTDEYKAATTSEKQGSEIPREPDKNGKAEAVTVIPYELATTAALADRSALIARIVEKESPIHKEELLRRAIQLSGYGRMGNNLRAEMEGLLSSAMHSREVISKGDFIWSAAMKSPPLRRRDDCPEMKKIELICIVEISLAIWKVVVESVGIGKLEIVRCVSDIFGFARLTENIDSSISSVVEQMMREGMLKMEGRTVTVCS